MCVDIAVAASAAERPVSLDGFDTTPLASGHIAIVTTGAQRGNQYRLDLDSTAAADGVNVVAPLAGPGRWLLVAGSGADPAALLQDTWFINALTGNDANDGLTAGTALASWGELRRRYGDNPILPQTVTVNIGSDLDEDIFLNGTVVLQPGVLFRIFGGVRSVFDSGTLTNVTAQNRATQTPMQLEAPGLDAQVGQRIRFTDGAAAGATCWAFRSPGADLVDCVQAVTYDATANPLASDSTPATPSGGDAFVVEEMFRVRSVALDFERLDAGSDFCAVVDSLNVVDTNGVFHAASKLLQPVFVRCAIASNRSSAQTNATFVSCSNSIVTHNGLFELFDASLLKSPVSTVSAIGGRVLLKHDTIVANGAFRCLAGSALLQDSAVFDSNGSGIQLEGESTCVVQSGTVWGNGNADFGFNIRAGSVLTYPTGNKPILTGDTGDTQFGGATVAYAAIPSFDTNTASGMVADV